MFKSHWRRLTFAISSLMDYLTVTCAPSQREISYCQRSLFFLVREVGVEALSCAEVSPNYRGLLPFIILCFDDCAFLAIRRCLEMRPLVFCVCMVRVYPKLKI